MKPRRLYALFARSRAAKEWDKWERVFPEARPIPLEDASKMYQSYLLTGVFPREDGDPDKEYRLKEVRD